MREFVAFLFVAAFSYGYALVGPGKGGDSIIGAVAVAIFLTATGWTLTGGGELRALPR